MRDRSDEFLMESYASGSIEAFDELFRRYEAIACAYFRRRVSSEDRVADLYQELFLRLHRARHTFDPSHAFRPWFFQVARNVLIDDTRRAFRTRELSIPDPESSAVPCDIEHRLAAREEAALRLARIPEESARIVVGAMLLGEGYGEIARKLGKSRDAVKQIASRSLRRLRLLRTGA